MYWKLQENVLDSFDVDGLVRFLKATTRFTQGENVRKFEEKFSAWQGAKYSVFVNSGSSANFLLINALKALQLWPNGSEVIVPAVTWPTTVAPILQNGLKPVFVDVNRRDLSFDYLRLEGAITRKTKAISVTHLIGIPADIPRIKRTIGDRDIVLLEDCCEAQGASIGNEKVGNFGTGSTFSFYWGHHMTTIEGGMVCTNDENLYEVLLLKRSHGFARELPVKHHEALKKAHREIDFNFLFLTDGFNFRNTELHAEIGIGQLEQVDGLVLIRDRNYYAFLDLVKRYPDDLLPIIKEDGISSFCLPFIFRRGDVKRKFESFLVANGIEVRPLLGGNLLWQPFLSSFYEEGSFDVADFLHENSFYIGNNQFVDEGRINFLGQLMHDFFGK